jgi:hypothetical protein
MTEKDATTLGKMVTHCRAQMENDLCEVFEELGPALVQAAITRGNASSDQNRRIAASTLKLALGAEWIKVPRILQAELAARAVGVAKPGVDGTDLVSLKLLSDAEETLQVASNDVLDRVVAACRDETNPLERRISYLALRSAIKPGDTTFKVKALWSCIETTCAEVTPDTEARVLLLKLVGEQLSKEMPQIFRVVNEALIEADILPRLKRSYRDTTPVNAKDIAEESAKMASTLDRLVKARSKDTSATESPKETRASNELFNSLKTLQAAPKPAAPGTHTNVVRLARDSGAGSDVKPLHAVTLDIVAELFDLIFSDANVSDGIKALVARLQATVLRAAMLNQRFFADRSHPARRFLDSISVVAVRWGKVVDASDPFYVKLSELVDTLEKTYDGDMAVFDTANAELDVFLAQREEIEEQENRTLADAVHAREDEMRGQREAEVRAQQTADASIAGVLVPEAPTQIEEFLRSYWRDVVQRRIACSGTDAATTVDSLQVAKDLLWTVTPKHHATDRQQQAASLPTLLKKINAGFDEIGIAPSERKAFMDMLVELQLAALRADKHAAAKAAAAATKAEKPRVRNAGPTLQVTHATDTGVRVQDISLPSGSDLDQDNTPDRADLRRVRQMVRGDWVDFITGGQSRRERLTWINQSRTLFLFSNSASACAISITPEALAVRLKNQTAVIVKPDRPIFERAIQAAIKLLDRRA